MPDYSGYSYLKPDWGHIYHPCVEDIPNDIPDPCGKSVLTTTFIDANLLFYFVTGRSATDIIHMLNKTPINWFCKKQNIVESASYGSDFTAFRTGIEQVVSLHTDLRYFGVPIEGPSVVFGDKKAVVDSSMNPSYRLKKRHNIISFNKV